MDTSTHPPPLQPLTPTSPSDSHEVGSLRVVADDSQANAPSTAAPVNVVSLLARATSMAPVMSTLIPDSPRSPSPSLNKGARLPTSTTQPTVPADRAVQQHQFSLPTVSTKVEALGVDDGSFVIPFGSCADNTPLPYTFYAPVLQPIAMHIQIRRFCCSVLEYASLVALDKGLNAYIRHLHSIIDDANLYKYHDVYHVRSEWSGNPFLYAMERFRLTQILHFFDDLDPNRESARLSSLVELINEVLHVTVAESDWNMIARQRLSGFYGPPFSMPLHP